MTPLPFTFLGTVPRGKDTIFKGEIFFRKKCNLFDFLHLYSEW